MKKIIIPVALLLLFVACSKEKLPEPKPAYNLESLTSFPYEPPTELLDQIQNDNLKLVGTPKVVRPDQIESYLGEAGKEYLVYQNVGLASAIYQAGENKLFVELLEFPDAENAFGFYSRLRSLNDKIDTVGAESYTTGNSRYAIKQTTVITISYESESQTAAAKELCQKLMAEIPGGNALPARFIMFPFFGQIKSSLKYLPYQFENIPGLDQVYTAKAVNSGDTLTLFLTMDNDSLKFKYLTEYAKAQKQFELEERFQMSPQDVITFEHPEYGPVVAVYVRHKLVGALGYRQPDNFKFINDWFRGLK